MLLHLELSIVFLDYYYSSSKHLAGKTKIEGRKLKYCGKYHLTDSKNKNCSVYSYLVPLIFNQLYFFL